MLFALGTFYFALTEKIHRCFGSPFGAGGSRDRSRIQPSGGPAKLFYGCRPKTKIRKGRR